MKKFSIFTIVILLSVSAISQVSNQIKELPSYSPANQELHDIITSLDHRFFEAYNTCDVDVHKEMISEDLEFYHDLGGLETSKKKILEALENNICGKVTRTLVEGTNEVYEIPGYGAVQMGWHKFFNNQEPNAKSVPSKFVTLWKNEDGTWRITRVISLH